MTLLLKNLAFTLLVPGFVAFYMPLSIGSRTVSLAEVVRHLSFSSFIVLALGSGIYFWCLYHFAVTGRGTPAPIDAPKFLVAKGLYRYSRNPMYIGVLLVICGWWMAFQDASILLYMLIVALFFHLFIILFEEPILRRKFGTEYDDYVRAVPRWIFRFRPTVST